MLLHAGIKRGIDNVPSEVTLSRSKTFLLSFVMCLPSIALAIWYPYVGKLGALIAAFSTMFVIYILPLATFAKAVYDEEKERLCSDDDFELVKEARSIVDGGVGGSGYEDEEFNKQHVKTADIKNGRDERLTTLSFKIVMPVSVVLAIYGISVFVIQLYYLTKSLKNEVIVQ